MEQLINIGFGNFINRYKMIAVISPDSAPAKRMIQNGKEQGTVIDATQGRRTRAVIVMALLRGIWVLSSFWLL